MLQAVGEQFGMPVVTEVMDPRQVELVERYADMFQIGARNMQNFDLLKEVGQTRKPVLLKRGMSATVKDLLMSAEYILAAGQPPGDPVRARGPDVRGLDAQHAGPVDRAQRQGAEPPADHRRPQPRDRPARPDPGDGPGGVAAGADGVHIEVHTCPEKALSDGPQALLPDQYARLMDELRQLAELLGKTIDVPEGVTVACAPCSSPATGR